VEGGRGKREKIEYKTRRGGDKATLKKTAPPGPLWGIEVTKKRQLDYTVSLLLKRRQSNRVGERINKKKKQKTH